MVLRRGAQQRHASDVDRLHRFGVVGAGCDGLDEGVKIDDHEIDQLQLAVGKLLQVARFVASREDPGVHIRVQGLDPAIQHLGKSRQFLKRMHWDFRLPQGALGAASGVDRDAETGELAGEIAKSGLVRNAEQRVHREIGSGCPASRFTTPGSKVCSSAWIRSRRLSTVSSGRTSTRRWARIGP